MMIFVDEFLVFLRDLSLLDFQYSIQIWTFGLNREKIIVISSSTIGFSNPIRPW